MSVPSPLRVASSDVVIPTLPVARKRSKPSGSSAKKSAAMLGRDQRAIVEDPVLLAKDSRPGSGPLNLLLRVRTNYRSVAGSRRQILSTERQSVPLVCKHLQSAAETLGELPPRTKPIKDKSKGALAGGSLPAVKRQQWMVVPEFLSEELWERHRYSLTDIRKTLDAFPPRILWQLVISYNRSATNASSKICSDHDLKMTFGGKSTAIQKLLLALKELHPDWGDRPSVTWSMHKLDDPNGDGQFYDVSERHIPGLPVHRIKRTTFMTLLNNLVFWPSANIMNRSAANAALTSAQSIDKTVADNYYILTGLDHRLYRIFCFFIESANLGYDKNRQIHFLVARNLCRSSRNQ